MNPSYFRICISQAEAMRRFSAWIGKAELELPREVDLMDAVTLACDENGQWRGSALYLYQKRDWTVFEDLSGHFCAIGANEWLSFAQSNDFVFAGYNDAIGYGELIIIENGRIVREFLQDLENPDLNVDVGAMAFESGPASWITVAGFVDDDEFAYSDRGLLWIH